MKSKICACLLALCLTITAGNVRANAIDDKRPKNEKIADMTDAQKAARLQEIKLRVDEIKAMDKSSLSSSERKALRKELRHMQKEAKVMRGGVYLSVGAIIIIILVLILIL
jgi:hypothetical protein